MSHIQQFQHLKIKLEAIQSATNNFSADNCIGHGGFGNVYKGELIPSTGKAMVPLKRLDRAFGQGDSEFWKEIMTLSFYRHENIVSLLGYCDDHGEKILVYEYASNKSLDSYLASDDLTWVQRLKICIGAARGLAYIHTPSETQLRIFHRNIKSSNILLDSNWNAKISDFGLSKFAPANKQFTFLVSNPVGTPGYIDPLYHKTGLLTKESDVYSFGVVLFEVLCGRLCFGTENLQPLIGLVRQYYSQKKISELVLSYLKDEIKESSLKLFVDTAYKCLNKKREERPLMTQIVSTLEKALDIQENADAEAAFHRAGILNVNVFGTSDVRTKNPFDDSNHYIILLIDRNGPLRNKKRTEWNEESTLYVQDVDSQSLCILVYKIISVKKHRQIGKAELELGELTPDIPQTCNLHVRDVNYNYLGDLKIEVLYKPTDVEGASSSIQKAPIGTPKDGGLLVVIIHGADLDYEYFAKSSSVLLLLRDKLRKTVCMTNTKFPVWLQEFRFMFEHPPMNEELHLRLGNKSWTRLIPGNKYRGWVRIRLAGVVKEKWINKLYEVERGDETIHDSLQVELQWRTSD